MVAPVMPRRGSKTEYPGSPVLFGVISIHRASDAARASFNSRAIGESQSLVSVCWALYYRGSFGA